MLTAVTWNPQLASQTWVALEQQLFLRPAMFSGKLWTPLSSHARPMQLYSYTWRESVTWVVLREMDTNVSSKITSSTPDFLLTSRLIWYLNVSGSFFFTKSAIPARSSTSWNAEMLEAEVWVGLLEALPGLPFLPWAKWSRSNQFERPWYELHNTLDDIQYRSVKLWTGIFIQSRAIWVSYIILCHVILRFLLTRVVWKISVIIGSGLFCKGIDVSALD